MLAQNASWNGGNWALGSEWGGLHGISCQRRDHADAQAFDDQFLLLQIDFDPDANSVVFRQQPDLAAFALTAFHRASLADPRDHHLAVARFAGDVDGQQVAVEDADVLHTHTAHINR